MVAIPKRMSHYPGGFGGGLTIRGVPIQSTHAGAMFWVDENANNKSNNRGTFDSPCSSIDNAMALCVANRGDIIGVKPGHVENISAAAALTCDVAGVAIVGFGVGSKQAKIVWDTAATADIDVTAADVTFSNLWLHNNYANVDGCFDVAATGDYFTIQGCRWTDGSNALEMEEGVNLADDADHFAFINNVVRLYDGSGTESLVFTTGESIDMLVEGNSIIMEASTSIFDIDAEALTGTPLFRGNAMVNLAAAADYCVEINASTAAIFIDERYGCAGEAEPVNDPAASYLINCHGVDGLDQSSLIFPKTATAWP